jgi:hypothetical protein
MRRFLRAAVEFLGVVVLVGAALALVTWLLVEAVERM